jgi:hypothetical protein
MEYTISSFVWHHDRDRSGDVHVEVDCDGGNPKILVFHNGRQVLEKIYEYQSTTSNTLAATRDKSVKGKKTT